MKTAKPFFLISSSTCNLEMRFNTSLETRNLKMCVFVGGGGCVRVRVRV